MNRQSTLSLWCERLIEAGWLLAVALIPIYFNLYSARHFEPDKASVLRTIVLMIAAFGLIRALEGFNLNARPAAASAEGETAAPKGPSFWQRFYRFPMALPTVVYATVFLFTTFTSVVPLTSFWGSYQRLQGTYTNLSYIGLGLMIAVTINRRSQIERLLTVILCTSVAVAGYGVMQHNQLDPLPWRGDVITRVASTMGNSIFVAAYMIMVVPFALYRMVVSAAEIRRASPANNVGVEWLWFLARALMIFGGLALLLFAVKFGASVRTIDLRYWWAFPGAISVATALWWTVTLNPQRGDGYRPIWPLVMFLGYIFFLGSLYVMSQAVQVNATDNPKAADWGMWMLISLVSVIAAYVLYWRLPQINAEPSRIYWWIQTVSSGALSALLLLVIFYTQSRGPWLGIGAGLVVFFFFTLLLAMQVAKQQDRSQLLGRLRLLMGLWVVATLGLVGFLLAFNLTKAPIFEPLRTLPYIGRMGQLLEVDTGTGLVRRLIWIGDQHAKGAIGLITSDPVRMVIGWGPESMFVAYNPFYPPSLANIESRGASPDRSHQAILDELVTKGLLGLSSYLYVLGAFVFFAWRWMFRSSDWRSKILFVALISSVVSNFVEGLTGIPIVSSLMMFWVAIGLLVAGGRVAGFIGADGSQSVEEPVPVEAAASPASKGRQAQRGQTARRGAPTRGRGAVGGGRNADRGPAYLVYGLIGFIALLATWWFNVNPIYADMRFQQGQAASGSGGANGLLQSMDDYLVTIRSNPREDFYYLNLGRVLMSIADAQRAQGVALGEAKTNAKVEDLLALQDITAIQTFVQANTPLAMMTYAEAVLTRAHELNSLNKDHYANLGRLNNFWYGWTRDPQRLQASLDWFTRVTTIAPQDVALMNERAAITIEMARYMTAQNDTAGAQNYYAQAEELLNRSRTLDPNYSDTDLRLGELLVGQGRLDEATVRYVAAINRNPSAMVSSAERIAGSLASRPDLLKQVSDEFAQQARNADEAVQKGTLRVGPDRVGMLYAVSGLLAVRVGDNESAYQLYQRAAVLQPNNYEFRRNYTVVLSDTQRYAEAATEANAAISLISGQQGREAEVAQLQALVAYLQQRAANP